MMMGIEDNVGDAHGGDGTLGPVMHVRTDDGRDDAGQVSTGMRTGHNFKFLEQS
jgi:hypothetical protein